MSEQKYPRSVSLYRGEGRYLIIPVIRHMGGYSVNANWYRIITIGEKCVEIGNNVFEALTFIEDSPLSSATPKERENSWKTNSKYKNWISFWKNNLLAKIDRNESGTYEVYSMERFENHKGVYNGCIKEIQLPATATAEDIGRAVIEVFEAAEEFYKDESKKADKE